MRWSAAQALAWIIRRKPLELKEWTSKMGPKIEPAAIKLSRAIGAGQVRAWGRPGPHALIESIPNDQFRIPGFTQAANPRHHAKRHWSYRELIVSPHGDLTTSPRRKSSTYEGPRWYGVEFDSAEIKRAFPKPPSTSAKKWVLKEAKRLHSAGKIGKREDMLKRCMQDTGCTKREAEAAHKNLPDKFKRPRGKPRKSPG
jgi:hypothetical protein